MYPCEMSDKFSPYNIIIMLAAGLLAVTKADHQTYPGTSNRPVLSDNEAVALTEADYLQGWRPENVIIPASPDYSAGPEASDFSDIQAAVNQAINDGGTVRKYIAIRPGNYSQTVYITGNVPLTIYGTGDRPEDVNIILSQPSDMAVAAWIEQVNPGGSRYKPGDPAYNLYNKCASTTSATIGGSCSSIFWINATDIQVSNLQVTNFYSDHGTAQSVALKTDADRIRLSRVNLISRQDTFYAGSGRAVQRLYVDRSYIEGDIDFVFGGASAVFFNDTFKAVSDRHPSGGCVFAPNTDPANAFGFLVMNSTITADAAFQKSRKVALARAWDTAVPKDGYVVDVSPNGQLEIRHTRIDDVINVDVPYNPAATSGRKYSGNAHPDRDLNDNNYNRFWEYQNTGAGA